MQILKYISNEFFILSVKFNNNFKAVRGDNKICKALPYRELPNTYLWKHHFFQLKHMYLIKKNPLQVVS